jgi:hypothetical protein
MLADKGNQFEPILLKLPVKASGNHQTISFSQEELLVTKTSTVQELHN